MKNEMKPIIFACSGCSEAGKTAYDLALYLDKTGKGEMSCLAGLSAGLQVFKNKVKGRKVWIVDGCPIRCSKEVLKNLDIQEDFHIKLDEHGIKKYHNPEISVNQLAKDILYTKKDNEK